MRDRLAGRKVLLTGASGFLGKAVLGALLRSAPDIGQLVLLLRAPGASTASERLDSVLASDAFAELPAAEIRAKLDSGRIRALRGDLEIDGLGEKADDTLAGVDTVIHCAATVSFEEALDDALALNTFGPIRLLQRLRESGSDPELVHVSTAYVADRQSGRVLEDGAPHQGLADLDPEALFATARRWREELERESIEEPQRGGSQRRRSAMRPGGRTWTPRHGRRSCAGAGSAIGSRGEAAGTRSSLAGPTPMPSRRPSASASWPSAPPPQP